MGTPVVSTRSGGIPEAVAHDHTGLLVDERDPHALAEAVIELLGSPERWRQFSENGIRFVRENFDLAKQTAKLEDLYRAVAAHREATHASPLPEDAPALA
jgi:glycosyltransferase involved in cell wall biosynthesis